jgi:hypothetical protein
MRVEKNFPGGWLVVLLFIGCSGGAGSTITVDGRSQDAAPDVTEDGTQPVTDVRISPETTVTEDILLWETDQFEPIDIFQPDQAVGDDVLPDLPDTVEPGWCDTPGSLGCPCQANMDCNSGWCVETASGYVCTQTCVEECPLDWNCVQFQAAPDVVYACIPNHARLCRPCGKSQECQGNAIGVTVACVSQGESGNFCGGDCTPGGAPCPEGYVCQDVQSVEGETLLQCVPEEGECSCSPFAVEEALATSCYFENEYGLCSGERFCAVDGLSECSAVVPAPEICNGLDDDCDGVADNDLIEEDCLVENQYGACTGKVLCVGGEPICQGKEPAAETCDGLDNDCDGKVDEDFGDCDEDGISDCIETDDDADGILDDADNCPCLQNPNQFNYDNDALGDVCDPDDDNDGVADQEDCQPKNANVYPGVPEACNGLDDDCDELVDEGFLDSDSDGQADCVDNDDDGDTVPDGTDNCPNIPNLDQLDTDFDQEGDLCDADDDGDGFADDNDCGPLDKKVFPGAAELCDCKDNNCDGLADEGFTDTDNDGIADCCEDDTDNDGIPDGADNCKFVPNPDQLNTDGDVQGNACDADDDNDTVIDELDCAPLEKLAYPNAPEVCDGVDNDCDGTVDNGFPDLDEDDVADCIDPDDDGDLVPDGDDICPFVADPLQLDFDQDGFGDACDGDDDGDGDFDLTDCEPLNPEVNKNAVEICNGKDDNCDDTVDEPGSVGCVMVYPDVDGDEFGADGMDSCRCTLTPPYTSFFGGDCNDDDEFINPAMEDICNGLDDDCDGQVDPVGCDPDAMWLHQLSGAQFMSGNSYKMALSAGVQVGALGLTNGEMIMDIGLLPALVPAQGQ